MKFRTIIALSLVLILFATLATPALAGRPIRSTYTYPAGNLVQPEGATADYALQVTHDNRIKVTIVLHGAAPATGSEEPVPLHYGLYLRDTTSTIDEYYLGNFWTNDKGNARYSGVTSLPLEINKGVERNFDLFVVREGDDEEYFGKSIANVSLNL